ncbi:MAG: IclR family transcriptional regulator [Mobilicoccus sp.]|nr:IclR family transcriptional regulator [Mobilicoccus sp.]
MSLPTTIAFPRETPRRRILRAVPPHAADMEAGGGAAAKDPTLKSVGTALDLLSCFAHDTELGVSDVARRLGTAKSTAHRLLSTLRSRGLVEQDPETGLYRLGLRLAEYGNLARDRHPVRHAILTHLVELRRAAGLPVRVGVPDGADIVHVDHLSSSAAPAQLEQMPWRLPLHRSAAGLAVCAFNDTVAGHRRAAGFGSGDPVRSDAEFTALLAEIRTRGVAVQQDGAVRGVTTISAPILDADGVAFMGVGLIAPTADLPRTREQLSRLVGVASSRISRSASPVIAERGTALLPALIGRHTQQNP